jgi:D-alanyl-D-alanine carboxypeptidase (penicillin-binding protein 5/6)
LKEFEFAGINQFNRNDLLWRDEDVDGLKTGHTQGSGFHMVATAKKVNQRFIAVVMGAGSEASREKETYRLLEHGFRNFSTVTLFEKGERLKEVRVWKGKVNRLNLMAARSGIVTVPKREKESISSSLQIQTTILAPVQEREKMGKAIIEGDGKILKEVDLLAEREVPMAGFLKRIWHSVLLFFVRLFSLITNQV